MATRRLSSVSHRQQDDPLRELIYPVNDAIVAKSKTEAPLELSAESFSGVRLGLQQPDLLVNAPFEVRSQFPEALLELSGRL